MCFETIYLCSALVHDEYRKKGIAKKICLEAIEKIQKKPRHRFVVCMVIYPRGCALRGVDCQSYKIGFVETGGLKLY
jgi:hypothetical protein